MASAICDTGKTRLSFADTRRSCRLSPAMIGRGNVESTPIGFVHNGETVKAIVPEVISRDKCASVYRKPACAPC